MCDCLCVACILSLQDVPLLRLRISLGFSNSRPARPSSEDKNTQEVPGKVDRQDYGQRQQANHRHEQDDVALEGQVCDGVDAAFATDLVIPTEKERGETFRIP